MNKKVLIIDKMHESITPLLAQIGFEADYRPNITKEEVYSILLDYTGVILRSKVKFDQPTLEKFSNLSFIARAGSGLEKIDLETAKKMGIKVVSTPEGNRDAVAEHALGMLLALFNNLIMADCEVQNFQWLREKNRGVELKGKTVAILGYGNNGREFAKRLKYFGCRVIAYDYNLSGFSDEFVEEVTLQQTFKEADVLSLHISMTKQNFDFVDKAFLEKFEKSIYLVNTARGKVLNLKDLCQMLENEKVLGACLDVLDNENITTLTDEQKETLVYLNNSPNVILSPHIAGWTHESYQRINEVIVEKIKASMPV